MRRKDQEITSEQMIEQILAEAQVCRLGLCQGKTPYVVPVSFGYDGTFVYFHTAPAGMKIDFIAANDRVCFELEHEVRLIPNDADPCRWSFSFFSVIGFGRIEEITDRRGKVDALNQIMKHYSGRAWSIDEPPLGSLRVWRIVVEQITGKRSKDKKAL
jgi:nitroimidazol reductase NimA-like FMN-containing flavoprotein (pyridoxamine 5'-phosphate oxidase superfamily)